MATNFLAFSRAFSHQWMDPEWDSLKNYFQCKESTFSLNSLLISWNKKFNLHCNMQHSVIFRVWTCCFALQELSQEKQRTLELLGVKEGQQEEEAAAAAEESSARRKSEDGEDPGDVDLLQDLRHIEEQMKVLLEEKEQADDKWVRAGKQNPGPDWEYWFDAAKPEQRPVIQHFTIVL